MFEEAEHPIRTYCLHGPDIAAIQNPLFVVFRGSLLLSNPYGILPFQRSRLPCRAELSIGLTRWMKSIGQMRIKL